MVWRCLLVFIGCGGASPQQILCFVGGEFYAAGFVPEMVQVGTMIHPIIVYRSSVAGGGGGGENDGARWDLASGERSYVCVVVFLRARTAECGSFSFQPCTFP